MVQPHPVLLEALVLMSLSGPLNAERRAPADVIDEIVAVIDLLQAEKRQQLAVERPRLVEVADSQNDVGHAVNFDHRIAPGFAWAIRCLRASSSHVPVGLPNSLPTS